MRRRYGLDARTSRCSAHRRRGTGGDRGGSYGRGREACRGGLPRAGGPLRRRGLRGHGLRRFRTPALDFDLNARPGQRARLPGARGGGGDIRGARPRRRAGRRGRLLPPGGCEVFGVIVSRVPPRRRRGGAAAWRARGREAPVYVLAEHPELAITDAWESVAAARRGRGEPRGRIRWRRDAARALSVTSAREAAHERGALPRRPRGRDARDRARRPRRHPVASLSRRGRAPASPRWPASCSPPGTSSRPAVRRLLEAAPFPVLAVPDRTYAVADGGRTRSAASWRPATSARSPAALGVFERRRGPLRARGADRPRAPRADDAGDVRVRADRAGQGEPAAHRAARGRRRARAARRATSCSAAASWS